MLQAEQATSAPEDRATIATLIGDQLLASRDLTGAAAAYERAARRAPGLATTEIGRARLAAAQGRLDEARRHLDRARRALPRARPGRRPRASSSRQPGATTRPLTASPSPAPAPSSSSRAGSTVDLESALFAADHGDATEAVTLAEAALPHAPHRLHRRRAGLGAARRPVALRRRCRTSTRRCRLGHARTRRCTSMRPSPSPPPVIPHRPPPPCERPSNRRPGWSRPCGRRRLRWPTAWASPVPEDWRP